MAVAPLQLPGYAAPQSLDFTQLANLGQVYKQANQDATRQQTLAQLGQGDKIDPRVLLASGDLSLANLGVTLQNQQTQGERDTRDFAFRQEEAKRAQQNADRSYGLQARAASRADEGPLEKASQRAKAAEQFGLTPGTPEHKTYVLTGELPSANTTVQAQTEQRKAAAQGLGLTPENPAYNSFVLTGKMPREDAQPLTAGDKEAIRAADDAVLGNKAAIDSLSRAKELSKKAFAGPMAGARGYAASFLGETSDTGKGGIATENLTNEVMTNALGQLKTIFGGNPTEGERKILLDLQGSVSKPDNVRQAIFDRAIAAAQKRLEFNQQRADQLRGGSYYKPGQGGPQKPAAQATPAATQQGDPLAAARDAIQRGADPAAVRQRLQQNGIDPSGL